MSSYVRSTKRQRRMDWRDKDKQRMFGIVLLALAMLAAIVIAGVLDESSHQACLASKTCVELGQ